MGPMYLLEMFSWGYHKLPKELIWLLASLEAVASWLLLHEKQELN